MRERRVCEEKSNDEDLVANGSQLLLLWLGESYAFACIPHACYTNQDKPWRPAMFLVSSGPPTL